MCVFMPVPHCFDYCSFEISFGIRKCDNFSFILLFVNITLTTKRPILKEKMRYLSLKIGMEFLNTFYKESVKIPDTLQLKGNHFISI
jgi:hypothetical protein